jgi:uncharacterized membrane protein (UPF0182 family)
VGLIIVAAIIFVFALSIRGLAGFYTDYLWFGELHLTSVFSGVLRTKFLLGLVFTVGFFILLWANLAIADRIAPGFRPAGPEEELVERFHDVVGPHVRLLRTGIAALFALIAGPGAAGQWNSWIQFRNYVPFHVRDPQFHRDVGFYVFRLPFAKYLVDWAFASIVIILIVTAVAHYLNGGIRLQTPFQKVTPQVKAHLSVLLGVLALLKAAGYFLQQYELVFSTRGVVQGASYTDVKAQLPAIKLLIVIALAAFVLFLVNILRRGWVLPLIAVGLWAFVSIVVGAAYPAFIQNFRVNPTESTKERPYIQRNITATRAALNIADTQVNDFRYSEDITSADLVDNAETIRNVRLWDPRVLTTTYRRLQEIRTFFQFNDVDVDRYKLDNRATQVLLSARELNPDGVPSPSWENQHVVFTHGYGAAASPANAVTASGGPDFIVKDLPPQGVLPITRPEIYFGDNLSGYAVVNTKKAEIDYTAANGEDHTSRYAGRGGVKMGSTVRRLAFALRFGSWNPLISGFITKDSKAIYIRDIRQRVRKAAPFLHFDNDPYPVLTDGRIVWVQDAYTVTSRYPYAQRATTARLNDNSGLHTGFNYARNSVKVAIDAYNGDMKFYVVDSKDPIVASYRKAFPKLFTSGDRMPADLVSHLRYPEDLFRVQTDMFGTYHMTDPSAFYKKADKWDIAQDPGGGELGQATQPTVAPGVAATGAPTGEARVDAYYLLMRLPNEVRENFLIFQPFVPTSKNDQRKELSAFMIAKSDPGDFGKLEAFVMPRELQVNGPAQVDALINQEPAVSRDITLLGTGGSKVVEGNLLIIPVKNSLIYIRPLYVQSERTPLPEFKKVIVVYADKVVMRDTLKEALEAIFGAAPPTLEQKPGGQAPAPSGGAPPAPAPPSASAQQLLDQADAAFRAADEALRRGDLATYQQKVNEAADLVRRAREASAGSTPPATTSTRPASTTTTTSA